MVFEAPFIYTVDEPFLWTLLGVPCTLYIHIIPLMKRKKTLIGLKRASKFGEIFSIAYVLTGRVTCSSSCTYLNPVGGCRPLVYPNNHWCFYINKEIFTNSHLPEFYWSSSRILEDYIFCTFFVLLFVIKTRDAPIGAIYIISEWIVFAPFVL